MQPTVAAMQRSGLGCCDIMGAFVGLAVYWGGREGGVGVMKRKKKQTN